MKQVKIRWIYWINILLPFLGIILLQLVVRVNAIKNNYQIYSVIFIILMLLLIIASYLPIKKRVTHITSNFHIPMMICWIQIGCS